METKKCTRCGEDKPVELFYRKDGKCRPCKNAYKRELHQKNKQNPEYIIKNRERNRRDYKRWEVKPETVLDWLLTVPRDRTQCRFMTSNAVNRGVMKRQPCQICGAEKATPHHFDYERPFEVRWLCRDHHCQIHNNYREYELLTGVSLI